MLVGIVSTRRRKAISTLWNDWLAYVVRNRHQVSIPHSLENQSWLGHVPLENAEAGLPSGGVFADYVNQFYLGEILKRYR